MSTFSALPLEYAQTREEDEMTGRQESPGLWFGFGLWSLPLVFGALVLGLWCCEKLGKSDREAILRIRV